eukprot:symbB.v1.2.035631.t1/scaffold4752.1/size35433/2
MERPVIVPPQAAAPRHRKGVGPLDPNDRTEKDRKMKVEEKRKPDREVSQKIAEVLAAARQRNGTLGAPDSVCQHQLLWASLQALLAVMAPRARIETTSGAGLESSEVPWRITRKQKKVRTGEDL